jgi:hypothetical protein
MDNNEEYNYKNNYGDYNEPKKVSIWWGVLGFFFPFIGLILFIIWNKTEPEKAKMVGKGALIGFIASIILPIILAIVFYYLVSTYGVEGLVHKVVCYSYGLDYQPYVEDGEYYCKNKTTGALEHLDVHVEGCDNGDCNTDVDEDEEDDELEDDVSDSFVDEDFDIDDDIDDDIDYYKEYEKCVKANNGMHARSNDTGKIIYDIKLDPYAKLSKPVDLKTSKSLNYNYELLVISENEKYSFDDEYITISNGKVIMHTRGKDYTADVKNAKYLYKEQNGEYVSTFAILTSDGDIYMGEYLLDVGDEDYHFDYKAFSKIKKVNSNNKYKDVNIILFDNDCHEKYWTADSYPREFVGITTDGKMDLLN